ncbi:MAG: phytoene/squalene synthase family protein, partial [Candidatus Hodarchaeota archaeon]
MSYSTKLGKNWDIFQLKTNKKLHMTSYSLEASYNKCFQWMALHSKSFFFASRFLPHEQRKSVAALYAFCRLTDDIVDEAPEGTSIKEIIDLLYDLKKAVEGLAENFVTSNPILQAFGDTIRKHNIPVKYIHELIEGV